jgi:hypothetical protein
VAIILSKKLIKSGFIRKFNLALQYILPMLQSPKECVMKKILFLGVLAVVLVSCDPKKSSSSSSNNSNSSNNSGNIPAPIPTISGGTTVTPGNEPGISDNGQNLEFFKINDPTVVLHGAGQGIVSWQSDTDLPSSFPQSAFITDGRFNVRVIPRIKVHGTDSKGVQCKFSPRPFTKLKVGMRLRRSDTDTGDYYLFNSVDVDQPSGVHEFTVPSNAIDPLVLEILDVQWDFSCIYYANQGFPDVEGVCEFDQVWTTECVGIEVQFSTDFTKDIPGPRIN